MKLGSLSPVADTDGSPRVRRFLVPFFAAALTATLAPALGAQEPDSASPETQQQPAAPPETEPPGEPAEAEQEPVQIEAAITVTARKREEAVTEVPFSVAAPTEEVLRERGADDLEDVASNVAGFTVQNLGPGQSQVAMRGLSAGQVARDQPGVKEQVGVYLDESVLSLSLFTPDIDLFDMNRVEVLRGPQGTLFGSGSLSGTVRYISNAPQLQLTEGVAELSLSTVADGDVGGSAKVAINRPLGEKAALRLVAYNTQIPGYIDAHGPGSAVDEDVNSGTRSGLRLALAFEPTDRLSIVPRILYQEVEMDGWNRIDAYNILGNPFTTTRPAVDPGERGQYIQLAEPFTDDFLLGDLTVRYAFDGFDITSITSVTDRDILVVRDAGALTGSITGGSIGLPETIYALDAPLLDTTTVETLTQELRASGEVGRLNWVVGAFYSTIDRHYDQSLPVTGFETLSGIPTQGVRADRDELYFSDLAYEFDQTAYFGEVTFAVADRLNLTAGIRFYDFEEKREQVFDGLFVQDPPPDGNLGIDVVSQPGAISSNGSVPRLIASYALSENTVLNAQISEGFRLGGINDPINVPLCSGPDEALFGGRPTWKDEELRNYELGSKSTILGGRGTFSVAGFHMDIENLQVTTTAGTCSSRIVFNVPEAQSQGLELELALQATRSFDFSISASYTDSELRSSVFSTDDEGNESIVAGMEEGNRLPTVPEFQAAAAASYRWQVNGNWAAYVTGTYQHIGSRYTQVSDHTPGFGTVDLLALPNTIGGPLTRTSFSFDPELPAYDLLNLRLGVFDETWELALFVNNVTDEIAYLALDQERGTLGRVGYLTNQPRTIGVSTRFRFW